MKALESMITDANALWLNVKHKGDIVECIIYQHHGSTNKSLEGIMDLVIHHENKLKAPQMRPSEQQEWDEQEMLRPVNR
eukprot:9839337-Heterocapsa_arctica.AAC.1